MLLGVKVPERAQAMCKSIAGAFLEKNEPQDSAWRAGSVGLLPGEQRESSCLTLFNTTHLAAAGGGAPLVPGECHLRARELSQSNKLFRVNICNDSQGGFSALV